MSKKKRKGRWDPSLTDYKIKGPIKDVTGERYGKLVPKYPIRTDKGETKWYCECDCGGDTYKTYTQLCYSLKPGNREASCGCGIRGKHNALWEGFGDISQDLITRIARGADKRNLRCSVTAEYLWNLYLQQEGKCALTGVPIAFGNDSPCRTAITASLDRIDSVKGYDEGNVQWVHKKLNRLKMALSDDKFIDICRSVVHHKGDAPVNPETLFVEIDGLDIGRQDHKDEPWKLSLLSSQYSLDALALDVFFAGCKGPHCDGCHNPDTWDSTNGKATLASRMAKLVSAKVAENKSLIKNVRILGGEPLDQPQQAMEKFLALLRGLKVNVWLFTRYELSEVPQAIKDNCDYIKTGRYLKDLEADDYEMYGVKLATLNQRVYKKGEDY